MEKSDHDLLIEIHAEIRHVCKSVTDQECRIRNLETQQNRWLGRDGAIVTGIAIAVSTIVTVIGWIASWVLR